MGVHERRSREKLARRAAILQAAGALFAERGLLASTIDELAERAEVAKGTIYLYFRSREEILSAVLEDGLARVGQRFLEAIDPSLPADENLRRLARAYCRVRREEPQYFKLLFFCAHADVKAKLCANPSACEGLPPLAALIQRGIDEGVFASTVDASKAAAIVWASSNGIVLMYEQPQPAPRSDVEIDDLLMTNMELFIRGLRANDA